MIKIVEGVEAHAQDHHKCGSEDPGEEVAVYYVGGLLPLAGADFAKRRAFPLFHELLHVGEFFSQFIHRFGDILDRLLRTEYICKPRERRAVTARARNDSRLNE